MKNQKRVLKIALALLCVFLVLIYTSVVFLPHEHCSCNFECAVCERLELSSGSLFAILMCTGFFIFFDEINSMPIRLCIVMCMRDATPVGLKVKLSN